MTVKLLMEKTGDLDAEFQVAKLFKHSSVPFLHLEEI